MTAAFIVMNTEKMNSERTVAIRMPLVLTTEEFARCVRYAPEVIRRKIRSRELKAYGRPARIPSRELLKFGVNLEDAALLLNEQLPKQSAV